jgi:hypothetical protein
MWAKDCETAGHQRNDSIWEKVYAIKIAQMYLWCREDFNRYVRKIMNSIDIMQHLTSVSYRIPLAKTPSVRVNNICNENNRREMNRKQWLCITLRSVQLRSKFIKIYVQWLFWGEKFLRNVKLFLFLISLRLWGSRLKFIQRCLKRVHLKFWSFLFALKYLTLGLKSTKLEFYQNFLFERRLLKMGERKFITYRQIQHPLGLSLADSRL